MLLRAAIHSTSDHYCRRLRFHMRGLVLLTAYVAVSRREQEVIGREAAAPWGEWISIHTADGERLATLYEPPAQGKPVILLFHGNADRISGYFFLAGLAKAQGYGLLAPAFRGYPGSTGKPSEEGILEVGRSAWPLATETATRSPYSHCWLIPWLQRRRKHCCRTRSCRRRASIKLRLHCICRGRQVSIAACALADQRSAPFRPAHPQSQCTEAVHAWRDRSDHTNGSRQGAIRPRYRA